MKPALSTPGDEYEREADRVAEQVMRTPDGLVHNNLPLSASDSQAVAGSSSPIPPIVGEVLHSPGEPLDATARAFMEPRFGADFGNVRIHSDFAAARSAQAVHAHAYTVGEQIVFNRGRYAPGTEEGRRLLAHELTHVMQRSGAHAIQADLRSNAHALSPVAGGVAARETATYTSGAGSAAGLVIQRQAATPAPNPAEYDWVPFNTDGTWDATAILAKISQQELTRTRTYMPLPGAGQESDEMRCAANATLAVAIAAGPKAVLRMSVNLYKLIKEYRDRSKAQKQTGMLGEYVCNKALYQIFDIARNVEFCMRSGSREGSACTMTFADFDRLANWLYIFSYNPEDELRRQGREGVGDLQGEQARFRSDNEIAESAKIAGYDKGEGRYRVKDEADLNAKLDTLKPGESLLGLWGDHTYTFYRDRSDQQIYLYNAWEPGETIFVRGSDGYNEQVRNGLRRTKNPMLLIMGLYHDPRQMYTPGLFDKHLELGPSPRR